MKNLALALMLLAAPSCLMATGLDLYPIGKNRGGRGQWQFGLDKGLTAGGCVQRELNDGQLLAGPCKDVFVLAKNGENVLHLGAYVMYNAERGNASYGPRLGVTVGPAAKALISKAAEAFPVLEQYADWTPPPFLQYLNKILTLDYGVAYRPYHTEDVRGNITHGPMCMLTIPLGDIYGLLVKGL